MEKNKKKSVEIVKSIRLLDSVLRTTKDRNQKTRVNRELSRLRKMLQEMYPDSELKELEDAILSEIMTIQQEKEITVKDYDSLKAIDIDVKSHHKEDKEINEVTSILKYFEERIWVAISDQYVKLDFSNSSERDTLHRKLDECNRAIKTFVQTIEDIEKSRSSEYINQLHLMRVRHGRLLLFEVYYFFKSAKKFISELLANYEIGGNMILNAEDIIEYAEYELYRIFENQKVSEVLTNIDKFIDDVLGFVNVPDIKT